MSDQPANQPQNDSSVMGSPQGDTYSVEAPKPVVSNQQGPIEKLEDQNIFTLLGVTTGTEDEKSQFLDELQQVIWEDFLENDVQLLILDSEHQKLQEILGGTNANLSVETQERVIEYLEELVPDLETIMVDKAIRLKADLLRERIAGMKELYGADVSAQTKIAEAEQFISQERWATAAQTLNGITQQ